MGESLVTKKANVVFKISGKGLAWYILPLPIIAFVLCVLLSLKNNFHSSTSTHCGVANYLPSISSAIGGYTPQRYIWRICIALHCAPRFVVAICYYNHYVSYAPIHRSNLLTSLAALNSLLHILEILCLVGLSYVSSTENFKVHEFSFIGFMVFSQVYMLLSLFLFKKSRSEAPMTEKDRKSYNWKFWLASFNIGCFLLAVYVYFRHNWYCEPGMYTIFALLEYSIVATNMAFHSTFALDFEHYEFAALPSISTNNMRRPLYIEDYNKV